MNIAIIMILFLSPSASLKKPTDETCDLCKMVVTYLESILKSNATEVLSTGLFREILQISKFLTTFCDSYKGLHL